MGIAPIVHKVTPDLWLLLLLLLLLLTLLLLLPLLSKISSTASFAKHRGCHPRNWNRHVI